MADTSATIIAASLNSDDLEKSINKLVETVATKTKAMADNFTSEVGRMERAVKNLGNIKIDSGGTADGGSSRRTSKQKEEESQVKATTQAYKEQNATLDQQAAAMKNAMQPKSARDSYYAFFQGYKQQAQELDKYIKSFESGLERVIKNRVSELNVQLANSKEKIRQLNEELNRRQFASGNPQAQAQIQAQLDKELRLHNQIEKAISNINKEFAFEKTYLASLYAEHHRISNIMRDEVSAKKQSSESTQKQLTEEQRRTEEIRKQAQAIRETQQWKEKGYAMVGDRVYYDPERSVAPAKNRLSLEEQILNTQKEEEVAAIRAASAQRQEAAEKAAIEQETRKVLAAEQQITAEQQKRSQPKTFASYDSLRESIAHVLGMQQSQIKLADAETASYNNLSTTLKQLKQAYDRLTSSERNSDQGKALIASIHEVERAVQKIKSQAARPVSLESIIGINGKGGLSEKTLDDIAYKMQRLASYRSGLDVNVRRAEIREVNTEYDRLKKKMDEVMQKNQQMVGSNNALGRSWNYMKNRLAFYFTVGASTQFIKNLIEVRAQYEMNERALGILINSAERGTQIFNELSQMALVSPYTLIELSNAAKQLTAYDIAAKDVVDTTRRLADMASAVGVPMERLTYALGQIKAYGYLNSRDARMFANAGIPLVRELSKYYTELEGKMVSVGDVYDRMKKKAIDFNSVMAVVTKMTDEGGKFFDFQAKMADTLKVRLANLTLAWNNMLNEMGAETQGVLTTAIGSLRTLFTHWKDIDKLLKTIAWTFGMAKLVQIIQIANIGLAAFGKQMAWNILVGRKLSATIFTLARSLKTLALSPITWITLLATAATAATMAILNMNEAQESLNKSLRENAKDNYKNIEQFLENYNAVRNSLYKENKDEKTGKTTTTPIDIDNGEAKKAWEAIREQIELSSHASDEYISRLLEVENISERVRQGFDVLEEIKVVSAALKELGDDAIKVDTDWSDWWNANLLPDGWVENLKDYEKELENVRNKYDDVSAAREKWEKNKYGDAELNEDFVSLNSSLVKLQNNIATTANSVYQFLQGKGWDKDINKINEVFKQVGDRMVQEGQLNPKDAFVFQTQWETARSEASKKALQLRIEDEKNALQVARDEERKADVQSRLDTLQDELKDFDLYNGKSKAYWENFTKWLKEQHRSEMTEMFRGMNAEQIKSINFQEGEYGSWVNRMVEKYKKENKLSNDEVFNYLHHWVINANKWSIFIPLTISTEDDKTIYQQLTEADSAIDTAYKKIKRLETRRDELSKKGGSLSKDKKVAEEYEKVLGEISDAQEDYNKALEKGGHSKKEDAANRKAQKAAESELAKALKDELKLIETVRSSYKDLTKEGASHADAVEKSVSGYEKSVANINKVLEKYGIKLDLTKFAGIANPHELQEMFKQQLNALAGKAKPTEIQAIEVELQKVNLDVEKYDLTKITKGLNNELDRLKEEYELAVSLDADPELGNIFADMMGINTDTLPRTIEEYASEYTKLLNKYLSEKNAGIELPNLNMTKDNMRTFEEMVKQGTLNEEVYKTIAAAVQDVREKRRKDMDEAIKSWDKLIEKYGEYEAKINAIRDDAASERGTFVNQYGTEEQKSVAVRLVSDIKATKDPEEKQKLIEQLKALVTEIAGNDTARLELKVAIDKSEIERGGKAAFEEFQKSPMWSAATGDLTGMTNSALKLLADDIERFKKSSKGLSGKQIRDINKALININKERKKGNPFLSMAVSIDNAKERMSVFDEQIKETEDAISSLEASRDQSNISETSSKIAKLTEDLKKLKEAREKAGELDATEIVANINSMVSAVGTGVQVINDLLNAMNGSEWNEAQEVMNDTFSVLEQGGQMAALGAQIGSGYGAIIGAVVGIGMGIATAFSDNWDKKVTAKIKDSELAVKRLEVAYVDLEQAIEKAYGTATIGAKQAALANKELQLEEIKRQILLEKSREAKYRDKEKIASLQKEYKELFYEIQNGYTEIVDDLLGTDAAGFAENLVSSMIEAFKQGEDYMKVFEESFDKMVDNMIMKSIVSRVVAQYIDSIWESLDKKINERSKTESDEYARLQNEAERRRNMTDREILAELYPSSLFPEAQAHAKYISDNLKDPSKMLDFANEDQWLQQQIEDYRKAAESEEKAAKDRLDAASELKDSDIDFVMSKLNDVMPELGEKIKNILGKYYKFGESSETQLSSLQQGISQISEQTANSIEAYLNGVSQQVYLHSELLTQIRDVLVGGDGDIQLGVQAQMLLQLQQSYQVQMAIQGILEGWSTPSGMGVRVELIS